MNDPQRKIYYMLFNGNSMDIPPKILYRRLFRNFGRLLESTIALWTCNLWLSPGWIHATEFPKRILIQLQETIVDARKLFQAVRISPCLAVYLENTSKLLNNRIRNYVNFPANSWLEARYFPSFSIIYRQYTFNDNNCCYKFTSEINSLWCIRMFPPDADG